MRYYPYLIPKRIREMKEERGLSYQDMADQTGLARVTFFKILQSNSKGNVRNPTISTMIALAKLFDCSIEDFLT